MRFHHFPQDYISSGRGAITKLSKSQQINSINAKTFKKWFMCQPINPKGETLGTCGLEGKKWTSSRTLWVGLNFDTWLRVLKYYFLGSKPQLQY